MKKKIKVGRLYRRDQVEIKAAGDVYSMSFASDAPYERAFGYEVLDHSPGAARLDRLNNGGPVLVDHAPPDQVGAIDRAYIGPDGKSWIDYRFSRSVRGTEIKQDVDDEIRTHVSVGYIVHKMEIQEKAESGPDTFRVTDWEPLEVSFVSIAADDGVGPTRSDDEEWTREFVYDDGTPDPVQEKTMSEKETPKVEVVTDTGPAEAQRTKDIRAAEAMIKDLPNVADLSRQFQDSGGTVGDFLAAVSEARGKSAPIDMDPEIGLTDKEVKSFSVLKLVRAMADPRDRSAQEAAAFEFECSVEAEKKAHRPAQGRYIPADVVMRGAATIDKRDITAGPGGTGQYLVDETQMSMIDALQNQMVVGQLGATMFNGLVGDIAFPRENGQATVYWIGEGENVTESTPGFNQVAMTPKTIGAFSDLTRKIIQQSSISVENWLRGHLAQKLAIGMDLAAIHGSGANGQPLGITNTTGIGGDPSAENGSAPTYAHQTALEKEVAIDNALRGRMAFLTNPKVRWKLRQEFVNATYGLEPIWSGGLQGELIGYPAYATNQVSSTLTKGNQSLSSAIIFGNWEDLYIGFWGGLDINVDSATLSKSGGIRVVALQDTDIALAHVESFAANLGALTA